jgi:FtsP/CotA-like multicopper oxidase with cupredoxin domain
VIAAVHSYGGLGTVGGHTGLRRVSAPTGPVVRVRVVNTQNSSIVLSVAGSAFRVLALDGHDVTDPPEVLDRTVVLAGGGRVDLEVRPPEGGPAVRLGFGVGAAALAIGPPDGPVSPERALLGSVDFLSYGSPAPVGFDPTRPDRRFSYVVGRRLGFVDGRLASWWTVNGRMLPDVPMFTVAEGDIVVMTIRNAFGSFHPMHLHGHHVLVLERDGVRTTGSPWWTDSLDVPLGTTYVIAFVADNPGIWMDHCHNLTHSAAGLVAHLVYQGMSEPYRIGGRASNHPD